MRYLSSVTVILPAPKVAGDNAGVVPGSTSVTLPPAPVSNRVAGTLMAAPVFPFSTAVGLAAVPVSTGASLTAVTPAPSDRTRDHCDLASGSGKVAPRSTPVAARATVASDARIDSAPGVPLKSAAGTKRRLAATDSTMAELSDSPLSGTSVQTEPTVLVLYCHLPWAAVDALPMIAMPPSAVLVLPPPVTADWLSVTSAYFVASKLVTVTPGGLTVSSDTTARVTSDDKVGRSLTPVTDVPSTLVPEL